MPSCAAAGGGGGSGGVMDLSRYKTSLCKTYDQPGTVVTLVTAIAGVTFAAVVTNLPQHVV